MNKKSIYNTIPTRKLTFVGMIALLLAAITVRFVGVGKVSLWHDEAFSVLIPLMSWADGLRSIILDVHPPLYYFVLKLWFGVFSNTVFTLRSFSIACAVASIFLLYLLSRKAGIDRPRTYLATCMLAFSHFAISISQEGRMYTFGGLLILAASYTLLYAIDAKFKTKQYIFGICTGLLAVGAAYTHYYLLFHVVGLYGFWLVTLYLQKRSLKDYGNWLLSGGIAGLLYLPWLPYFFQQFRQVGAGYWIPKFSFENLRNSVWELVFGAGPNTSVLTIKVLAIVLLFALLGLSLWFLYRWLREPREQSGKALIAMQLLAPFICSILFSLYSLAKGGGQSVFLVRYFYFALPFLFLLLASSFSFKKGKWISLGLFVLVVSVNLHYYVRYEKTLVKGNFTGMAGLVQKLETERLSGEPVVSSTTFEFFNMKYYLLGREPQLLLERRGDEKNLPHYAGTAILSQADYIYNEDLQKHESIWMVWTNAFGGSEPQLPAGFMRESRAEYPDIRPYPGTIIYLDKLVKN